MVRLVETGWPEAFVSVWRPRLKNTKSIVSREDGMLTEMLEINLLSYGTGALSEF